MHIILPFLPGISRLLSNVTPVIILFVFSKLISTSELGLISYFISLITILGVMTDFGLPEALQRFIPQYQANSDFPPQRFILSTIALEFLIVSIIAIIVLILDLSTANQFSKGNTALLIFCLFTSAANTVILSFNGLRQNKVTSNLFLGTALVFLVLTFALYFAGLSPITAFLAARGISWLVFMIIALLLLNKQGLLAKPLQFPEHYLKFAGNNFLIMFATALFTQWDSVLVTTFKGSYLNGIYKSTIFLASLPQVLNTVLSTKLLPEFSAAAAQNDYGLIKKEINKLIQLILPATIIATLISVFIAEPLLTFVYNSEIALSGRAYFSVAIMSSFTLLLSSPFMAALQATNHESIVRNASILQSITFVMGATLLLPRTSISILPPLLLVINLGYALALAWKWNQVYQRLTADTK
jgi:stage V sporulation protein B